MSARPHDFSEDGQYVLGFVPVDMSAAANPGDWVHLEEHGGVEIIFVSAIGTAGQDPVMTLLQATSNAGAGSKALAKATYYKKEGATALSAVAQHSKETAAVPGTFGGAEEATSAENEALWVVPVRAEDLDRANGFKYVSASVADVGAAAQLGVLLYRLYRGRVSGHPQPSVIA